MESSFWCFVGEELLDIESKLQGIFLAQDSVRDYEDKWEWLEFKDRDLGCRFNFSREHNWIQGAYHKPLIVRLSQIETAVDQSTLHRIRQKLAELLKVTIYYGRVELNKNGQYNYLQDNDSLFIL